MKVTSSGIKDGVIEDKFGKRGTDFVDDIPSLSLPFIIHNAPSGTKSFAIVLKDDDAIPVAGFPWIHWLAANIKYNLLPENASRDEHDFIQGNNSWKKPFYGGMSPPNAPHRYDLYVYALNTELSLENGFTLNDLNKVMQGHVLDQFVLSWMYDN